MKRYFWIVLLVPVLSAFTTQCATNFEQAKELVIAVNEEERDAYFARDLDRLEAIWITDESAHRMFSGNQRLLEFNGWEEIFSNYSEDINNDEMWEAAEDLRADFSNYEVLVSGDLATIHHDIHWTGTYGEEEVDSHAKRVVSLLRDQGRWKILETIHIAVPDSDFSENLNTASSYHELKEEDIDAILTADFTGRNEKSRFTWNRDDHHNYLGNDSYKRDSIFQQIADGNWVATRFFREMDWQGQRVHVEMMHFKRFEEGKIAEIWEYGDTRQIETN
jgi:ketosteroid isomerase-like protein